MGYSFRLAARVLLYAPSHRQDSTYLCYTSRGALAGTRNSSMGPPHEGLIRWPIAPWANTLTTELYLAPPPWRIDPTTQCTMSERSYHGATSRSPPRGIDSTTHRTMSERCYHGATSRSLTMKDRSDDPSHHERTLLPRSYISLPHHEGSIRRPITPWATYRSSVDWITTTHLAFWLEFSEPYSDGRQHPTLCWLCVQFHLPQLP